MNRAEGVGPRASALLIVFATYVQFLLWAQFGFLSLLRERLAGASEVQAAMAAMGLAGLAASFVTGRLLARVAPLHMVKTGLLASAVAALLALPAQGLAALAAVAAAIGAATAVTTVAVAVQLPHLVPSRRFALTVGAGTGLAYLACNVPLLFEAPPAGQAWAVAGLCALAALLARAPREGCEKGGAPLPAHWLTGRGLAAATVVLLLLVGLDSAAFAWIQATPGFQTLTWGAGWAKPVLGLVHLGAALLAGALLDRGRFGSLLGATWLLFTAAFTLLGLAAGSPSPAPFGGPLYAVGISLYSVALVVLPASFGRGRVPARWAAAAVFGIAGWLGSALGVGMAQDLGRIPRGVLLGAGLAIVLAVFWARRPRLGRMGRGLIVPPAAGALAFLVWIGLWHAAASSHEPQPAAYASSSLAETVERGRQVYVAEGCLHCHSQYVRPEGRDAELWGPHRPLDRQAGPVLVGNRRQGPDLANVGNRRDATWQRLHLVDPQALVPGSRMPSYSHLFAGDGARGRDLVAYLGSLGRDTREERRALVARAGVPAHPGSVSGGRRLFTTYCSACHGQEGRGNGRYAPVLANPALDLGKERFWFVPRGPGAEPEGAALSRIVRFGIPATPMPGHEYLSEREVADLVAFVSTLPGSSKVAAAEPTAATEVPR
ncbi:MAG TPA: cbb3-type cytochrome c oxidase subunit II [Thermoanaerobaculia bacterium]|nr:cbb3-type cytochrome c oxidase subunit II [Thermoanaerobaculia bacterium]